MREIKFRAYHPARKQWAEDVSVHSDGSFRAEYEETEKLDYETDLKESKIMQFTGLLDKKGKDIYESDIIKPFGDGTNLTRVYWDYAAWQVYGGGLLYSIVDHLEVVGNIYETPELLKEPK